jgi:hypothetical protein
MQALFVESLNRGYHFDQGRIDPGRIDHNIPVTFRQIRYEWSHLMGKLLARDPMRYQVLQEVTEPLPHPLFTIIPGDVEPWEVIRKK